MVTLGSLYLVHILAQIIYVDAERTQTVAVAALTEIIIDKSGKVESITRTGSGNAKPMPVVYIMGNSAFADGRTLADMFIAAFGMPKEQDNEG